MKRDFGTYWNITSFLCVFPAFTKNKSRWFLRTQRGRAAIWVFPDHRRPACSMEQRSPSISSLGGCASSAAPCSFQRAARSCAGWLNLLLGEQKRGQASTQAISCGRGPVGARPGLVLLLPCPSFTPGRSLALRLSHGLA